MHRQLWGFVALCFAAARSFAAITGVVMTTDGAPIAGARVSIRAFESNEASHARLLSASPEAVPLASTQTDSKGTFSLDSPKEPTVDLSISARGYEPQQRRIERDEELGAIAMQKAETRKGTVTAGGKPVANASVALYYGTYEHLAKTDEQGRYEAPDPKHVRAIVVVHPDHAVSEETFTTVGNVPASSLNRTLSAGAAFNGRVMAATGDAPVASAAIVVDGWPLAMTGEDGTFTIAHMPPKWKTIVARKDTLVGQRMASKEKNVTIRVAKGATISGRLTDAKARVPIAGAVVRVGTRRFGPGSDDATFAQTDAKGGYSFVVPAGTFMVVASHPAYEIKYADAAGIAGQQTSKDIALSPLARVSGVVLDESKRPVAAASVHTDDAGGSRMGMPMRFFRATDPTVSGPDGRFSMRVTPDEELWLRAMKRGFPAAKSDLLELAAAERKSGIVLTIPTGFAVSGRVTDANGDPLAGVAVTTTEPETGSRGMFMRSFIGGAPPSDDDSVLTASDGSFTVRLKEGTYDFGFRREGFAPKIVRGQAVSATAAPTVEAQLEPAVEITGRVTRAGAALENVRVFVFGPGAVDATAVTGSDGAFTLSGLSPGSVRIMLRKEDDFVQEMRNLTAPSRDVVIELPPGGRISGRVVDKASGKPVTSFQAGISTSRAGGGMAIMAPPQLRDFTSDDGTFTLEGVPAGGVVLVASSPGYSAGRLNLTVEEGKAVSDVELQLDTGTKLIGRVTGSNGSPLADVQVRVMPSPSGGFAASGMERSATTDSNGEYSIEALEGEESVVFSHVKHAPARKSVTLKGRETRLDVQLSSGQRITGSVVTESGAPVADAEVEAFSSGSLESARTNASGVFELESASPGRYRFSANKAGFAEGTVEDFDISSGAPVRITLRTGGTIYGRVTGLTPQELTETFVDARSPTSSARGTVDANGNYRIEGVAIGTVTVRAMAGAGMSGSARQSAPQTVDLAAGGSHQLDIAFRGDIVISGRVLRNGAPIRGASVNFYPRGTSARSSGMSPTDEQGRYSVSGLEEGEYNVTVGDRMAPYSTTYQVRGTATYDVEYKTAPLRGRVLDVSTNEPLANVAVQLRSTSQSDGYRTGRGAVTDAAGSFVLDSVPPGSYTVTASKDGFGNEIKEVLVGDSAPPELEMHLSHNEDMVLSIVDARDDRAISARASVYDMQGRLVNEPRMMFGGGEPADVKLSLSPGSYTASISANGYATRNIRFQAPSKQTVPLSPGGTLLVKSKHSARVRVRFIDSMGLPYPRFSNFPPTRELVPSPGTTTMSNMAAGTYTMQLLGENDVVLESKQVVIAEAQTVTEEM
jgi:uncharacterized GH25 family protein